MNKLRNLQANFCNYLKTQVIWVYRRKERERYAAWANYNNLLLIKVLSERGSNNTCSIKLHLISHVNTFSLAVPHVMCIIIIVKCSLTQICIALWYNHHMFEISIIVKIIVVLEKCSTEGQSISLNLFIFILQIFERIVLAPPS